MIVGKVINAISGFNLARKQRRIADKIQLNEADRIYNTSQYAKEMLGNARMQRNAEAPGLDIARAQMSQAQANTLGAFQRGAGSGANFLAMAAASQMGANRDALGLSQQQAQFQQQQNANYNNALGVMVNEGDKEFQSRLNRYQQDAQVKNRLMSASLQNKANAWGNIGGIFNDIADIGLMMAKGGPLEKFGQSIFKKKGGGTGGLNAGQISSLTGSGGAGTPSGSVPNYLGLVTGFPTLSGLR